MENNKEFEVGYKKPPKVTRFNKGKSGNPKGRPKNSRNLFVLIDDELDKSVLLKENGRMETLTKREALAKRLVNSALSGDAKSTNALIQMSHLSAGREEDVVELSKTDQEQFERLRQRIIDREKRKENASSCKSDKKGDRDE